MRHALWVLLLCPLAYGAAPCPTGQAKDGNALAQIEQTWALALESRDAAALGCILAEEFEDADPSGKLTDRAATLGHVPDRKTVHNELSELRAHVHGEVGYIRGLATATDPQGKIVARVRFTDVYVYRDGRWQCVAGHESLLGDAGR